MTDAFPTWIENLTTGEQLGLAGIIILAVLLILLYLSRDSLRYWRESRQIRRAAKWSGARMLRNVRLPDGMGGETSIDFLALAAGAVLVIGVKRYDGLIFGSTRTDEWTQVINGRSYKFPNPDAGLLRQIGAVRVIVPGISGQGSAPVHRQCRISQGQAVQCAAGEGPAWQNPSPQAEGHPRGPADGMDTTHSLPKIIGDTFRHQAGHCRYRMYGWE